MAAEICADPHFIFRALIKKEPASAILWSVRGSVFRTYSSALRSEGLQENLILRCPCKACHFGGAFQKEFIPLATVLHFSFVCWKD